MKKITLFLSVCFTLYSQTDDYLSGYVITQTGDSIAGKILYKGNNSYNDVCIFREEGKNEDKHFTPNDIKSYRYFNSKCYVPMNISIRDQNQTVFVEYLLNGIVSIYYYGYQNEYYVKSETGEILLLSDEEKIIHREDGSSFVYRPKKYVGILRHVFANDHKTLETLDNKNIALNQNNLISLGKSYHNSVCREWECVVYEKDYDLEKKLEKDVRRKNLSVGFWGGINYSFIPYKEKYINEEGRYIESVENNNSVNSYNPYLGVFINYRLFFIHPNLDFKYELDYSQQTNKRYLKYVSPSIEHYSCVYDIEIISRKKIISNTFYLKYNFIKTSDYNMYIQGGYSWMYLPYNSYQRKGNFKYGVTINISTPEIKLKGFTFNRDGSLTNFLFDNGPSFGFGYQRVYKKMKLNGEIKYKTIFGNTIENARGITQENYNQVSPVFRNGTPEKKSFFRSVRISVFSRPFQHHIV